MISLAVKAADYQGDKALEENTRVAAELFALLSNEAELSNDRFSDFARSVRRDIGKPSL